MSSLSFIRLLQLGATLASLARPRRDLETIIAHCLERDPTRYNREPRRDLNGLRHERFGRVLEFHSRRKW